MRMAIAAFIVLMIINWLCSCGNVTCDAKMNNLCVIGSTDTDTVQMAISLTEKSLKQRNFNSSITSLISREGLIVEYVEPESRVLRDGSGDYSAALYRDNTIIIGRPKDCYHSYYLVGHELLHFYAERILKTEEQTNADHLVPMMFYAWTIQEEMPFQKSVEFLVALRSLEYCDYLENFPQEENQ